jgi:hypothetical protein
LNTATSRRYRLQVFDTRGRYSRRLLSAEAVSLSYSPEIDSACDDHKLHSFFSAAKVCWKGSRLEKKPVDEEASEDL